MRTHKDRGEAGAAVGGGISSAASGLRALIDKALELRVGFVSAESDEVMKRGGG
jgi:hypothetical protein